MKPQLKFVLMALIIVFSIALAVISAVYFTNYTRIVASLDLEAISLIRPQSANDSPNDSLRIPRILSDHDQDEDGLDDLDDILIGARAEVERQPSYKNAYYKGGYPPETEGVCTDVIWRAFKEAGYDLKALIDRDISSNVSAYPRVGGKPDPNIDFRRVPNLVSFFSRHALDLTIDVKPGDAENLKLWQGGDIVFFDKPYPHVAVISDKRRVDGVPLIIHNGGPHATEEDYLLNWPSPITHHFRFPKPGKLHPAD